MKHHKDIKTGPRKFIRHIFSLLILITLISGLNSLAQKRKTSIISAVRGEVKYKMHSDTWFDAKAGTIIEPGAYVRTGKDGVAEVIFPNGVTVRVPKNSTLNVPKTPQNKPEKVSLVKLISGKIWSKITGGTEFEIETSSAIAGVRGTVLAVELFGDVTRLSVFEGTVGFASITNGSKGKEVNVKESYRSFAQSGRDATQPQFFDKATEEKEWAEVHDAIEKGSDSTSGTSEGGTGETDETEEDEDIESEDADENALGFERDEFEEDSDTEAELAIMGDTSPMSIVIFTPPETPLEQNVELRGMVTNRTELRSVSITQNPGTSSRKIYSANISGPSFDYPVSLYDGYNNFEIEVTDTEGAVASVTHRVYFQADIFSTSSSHSSGYGTITGNVVDASTSEGISGAMIQVVGTSLTGTTDSSGAFTITSVPSGSYTLIIARDGYIQGVVSNVTVTDSSTAETSYQMESNYNDY